MNAPAFVAGKYAGNDLSKSQIKEIVTCICDPQTDDSFVSDFAKAVYSQGMSMAETCALTDAMRRSGLLLQWSVDGPVVDKHSTGGVGDLVSLILAPLLAACGCFVPMISGRCLGHTGGTIDKLESIPGYQTQPDIASFKKCVEKTGLAIIAQSADLAPADRRLYAMRNRTNTVNSVPLIVSSILSKKLAEGLDALVVDIKIGNGAWFETADDAQEIKDTMQSVAELLGVKSRFLLSSMDSPISYAVGNSLEVTEAIDFLTNRQQHPSLRRLVYNLASEALVLSGLAVNFEKAVTTIEGALNSGKAAERFAEMVSFLGGPADLLEQPEKHLPKAAVIKPVLARQAGILNKFNMKRIGELDHKLSLKSECRNNGFDHSTGISGLYPSNGNIEKGQILCFIHAASESDWQHAAEEFLNECISFSSLDEIDTTDASEVSA